MALRWWSRCPFVGPFVAAVRFDRRWSNGPHRWFGIERPFVALPSRRTALTEVDVLTAAEKRNFLTPRLHKGKQEGVL